MDWAHKFLRIAFINEEHVHSDQSMLVLDMDYFGDNMFSRPKSRVKQLEGRCLKQETVVEIVTSS